MMGKNGEFGNLILGKFALIFCLLERKCLHLRDNWSFFVWTEMHKN